MRIKINPSTILLWLSADDTYRWAHRPSSAWPGSQLSGRRLYAEFDSNGLVDYTVDGSRDNCPDVNEFNAITSDHLANKLPPDHPAYDVAVGQFKT